MSRKRFDEAQAEIAAWHAERKQWEAIRSDGTVVAEGDEVTSFRDEPYRFGIVTAFPEYGKEGKVTATKDGTDDSREFYPSVFGLTLRRREDGVQD